MEGKAMRTMMDDDILDRLVAYEKYVKKCVVREVGRRWRTMNDGVFQEYERIKEYKNYISTLVDHAIENFAIENGLMKDVSVNPDPVLNKGLESLIVQLYWPSFGIHLPSSKRQYDLVS